MIFPLPAGSSRRRRRLKRTGVNTPVLTGAWGRGPPTSKRRVYTGALLATTTAPHIINYFGLNQGDKLIGAYIQCIGDPKFAALDI